MDDSAPPSRTRGLLRRLRWPLAGVALLVVGYVAWQWIDREWPWHHFRTVEESVFYRSAQLSEDDLVDCIEDYGIKTVINLRTEAERSRGDGTWYEQEMRAIQRAGIKHLDAPVLEGHPPSPEQIARILAILDDPKNLPVLVHCEKGTIRSAAVEGLFRREMLHESGADAYARVETWGRDLEDDYPAIAKFIQTYTPRKRK